MLSKSFLLFFIFELIIPAIGFYILWLISVKIHKYVRRGKKNLLIAPAITSIYILIFGALYVIIVPLILLELSRCDGCFVIFLFSAIVAGAVTLLNFIVQLILSIYFRRKDMENNKILKDNDNQINN